MTVSVRTPIGELVRLPAVRKSDVATVRSVSAVTGADEGVDQVDQGPCRALRCSAGGWTRPGPCDGATMTVGRPTGGSRNAVFALGLMAVADPAPSCP